MRERWERDKTYDTGNWDKKLNWISWERVKFSVVKSFTIPNSIPENCDFISDSKKQQIFLQLNTRLERRPLIFSSFYEKIVPSFHLCARWSLSWRRMFVSSLYEVDLQLSIHEKKIQKTYFGSLLILTAIFFKCLSGP